MYLGHNNFLYGINLLNNLRDTLPQTHNFSPLRLLFIWGLVEITVIDSQCSKVF